MQSLHRAPLFFCCLPISSIRTATIRGEGGDGWRYDVFYFGGVVLSPFQLVGTMLSHGAPGNLGEKFHPARPEASNPYGAGNFSPVQTSSPISPLSRRLRKLWLSFHGMTSLYCNDRKIVPQRWFYFVEEDEMFQTDLAFILAWFFFSFLNEHVVIYVLENNNF